MIISIIIIIILLALDRVSKILLAPYLAGKGMVTLIPGVLGLELCENTGAAWSILSNATWLLSIFSTAATVFLIYLLLVRKPKSVILKAAMILIIAGGIGNLYDRIVYGAVIDFFKFLFINFPVFNVADCCITAGAALAIIYMIVSKSDEPIFEVASKKHGQKAKPDENAADETEKNE